MRKGHYILTTGVLGLCLALTTACGGGTTSGAGQAPAASAKTKAVTPSGFKRIGGAANGISVAVPKSWSGFDLTRADLQKGLQQLGLSGSALLQFQQSLRTLASNKAVWAADRKSIKVSPNRFATNLNGFCQPSSASSSEQLISAVKQQLGQINAKVGKAAEVRIDSGKAVRVLYTLANRGVEIKGTQYYVLAPGKVCSVTLSTDLAGKQRLFDQIGRTVRVV
jgi:hypothetical protein